MPAFAELFIGGLMSGLVVGLSALAITLVFGIARFPNAATGDVMTAGAYVALSMAALTDSVIVGGLVGAMTGAALAILSYLLVFRKLSGRSSVTNLLASIGIAFFLRAVIGVGFGHQQQVFQLPLERPWRILDVRFQPADLNLVIVAVAALSVVFLILYATPIGRCMRAVADDPGLAKVSGISPSRIMIALWALAGSVSAVAGVMYGIKTVVTPEMGWDMLLPAFAAAILGGIGNPVGAICAGILLGTLQEVATPLVGFTYKIAISFVVLLLVLLVRPRGLFGQIEGVR
ncbi:branched-chain amino acid ABC transporter permease [Methylobacterium nodulans]|uniref:Inner-membrane translocator n=1 Tax=Methylobacterium nodulans (strain LMG 21967 / CNCM I-2342 / ORS 2060) TaxID=460265 RepID=B8ISL3_METNO|nr:branched-chain amino acid ABC transporter permease [Methylobacterium nodulans]ACL58853.1 inner-membrane translocator [Methylobacterium nodulans ORS 2060]